MKRLLAARKRLPLVTTSSITLFSAEASLYRRQGWREGKESAGGTTGRGKIYFSTRAIMHGFCFRLFLFLLGYPAGATAEERGSINIQILCFRVNYCFLQYEPLIGSNKLSWNVFIISCDLIGKLCRVGGPGTVLVAF